MTHRTRFSVSILIWLHVIVVVLHGMAHGGAGVPFTSLSGSVLVVLAIDVGIGSTPLVALFLLSSRWWRWGAVLLCLCMLGSLLFGVWNHFLLPSPDNITSLSAGIWQPPFLITAFLLCAHRSSRDHHGCLASFQPYTCSGGAPLVSVPVQPSDPFREKV